MLACECSASLGSQQSLNHSLTLKYKVLDS
jgi:hypothetical protein